MQNPDGSPDAMIGRMIGNYRVLRKIGEGGMGTVYETVHATLGRRAAVKTLRRGALVDSSTAARFFNEAKAISMFSHPCLVTIYEHGTYSPADGGDDEAYIVMEYIEGESLRARLDQRYLGASAVGLVRQLASALAVAHKRRIIHRDLKPDNIMLVADDAVSGGVRPKILDFGLAKLLPQGETLDPEVGALDGPLAASASNAPFSPRSVKTRTGMLIGTPMYMSPEQCRGSAAQDGKTDVYSLGVIFYEMLYGDPPFVSDSAGELYAMHLFAPAPDLRQLVPAVHPKLAALVHRMLDKKAAARPSMEELVSELQEGPDSGLMDGYADDRPSALPSSLEGKNGKVAGTSDLIRKQLARRGAKTNSAPAAPSRPGREQISGLAGQGEQVAAQRPQTVAKVVAGGLVFVLASVAVFLFVRLQLKTPTTAAGISAPSPAARLFGRPLAAPSPADPPPAAAPPAPAPDAPASPPAQPPKQGTAIAARPLSKEKPARRKPHGSKKARAKYNVNLWK